MFDTILKEFEIEMMRADSIMESIYDTYNLESQYAMAITESTADVDTLDQLIYEADNKFADKVKKVLDAIIEAFRKLMKKIKDEYRKMVVKKELKKHLKNMEKIWKGQMRKNIPLVGRKMYKQGCKEVHDVVKAYSTYTTKLVSLILDIANAQTEKALDNATKKFDNWIAENQMIAASLSMELTAYSWATVGVAYAKLMKEIDGINNILATISDEADKNTEMIKKTAVKISDDDELKTRKLSAIQKGTSMMTKAYADLANAVVKHPFLAIEDISGALPKASDITG